MVPRDAPTASLLRSRIEAFSQAESTRRAAMAAASRGATGTRQSSVAWIPWGDTAEIAAVIDAFEPEYAAIRSGSAVMDLPQRGVLAVSGAARRDFLQRMVTQDLRALSAGAVTEAFWLNRKGRIDADLLICETGDRMLIDLPRAVAAATASALTSFVFSEDVTIVDSSESQYRLAVHGPEALEVLGAAGIDGTLRCASLAIAGVEVVAVRRDQCGVLGIELFVPREAVEAVWEAVTGGREGSESSNPKSRPCGWFAYNTARIEGGTPLFEIDFGSASLPHETGVLASRVSFTKGCYLGQEVVARMQSLGKPKQVVCAFRMDGSELPTEGAVVHMDSKPTAEPIGQVTSSTFSPMLAGAAIGFATLRRQHADAGNAIWIAAEGELRRAVVQPSLSFLGVQTAK